MRILMTCDCVGGVWSYAMTLCRALAAHDVSVTLAVTGGEMGGDQREQAAALGNVELHHKPFKCEWMQPPMADVAAAGGWLEALAEASSADLVHLNDYAHGGRDFGGRRRVVVAHSDVDSWHCHTLGATPDPAIWGDYARGVRAGLAGSHVVVAPTRAVIDDLRRHFGEGWTGVWIDNAVEPLHEEPGGPREPFVLCAGRVWDQAKNVRTLAEAAAGLPWPVEVAGDPSGPDGGTADFENVQMLGPLPHGELMRLMERAAVYALPAKYEPFGLSAVEAGLRGCALVLGDIPSLREVWGDAAIFVSTDDADALRATLRRLIDDPGERARLSDAARGRAARYTPEAQARAYVDLYRDLITP